MIRRTGILALVGAVGLALALVSTATAQDGNTIPGGLYIATTTESTGCDEGDIITSGGFSLRLNPQGTRVVEILAHEVYFQGTLLGRPFSIQADAPIASDGTFSGEISLPPITIEAEGRFEGDTVSGTFTVRLDGVLECAGSFTGRGEPPSLSGPFLVGEIERDGDCGGGRVQLTISSNLESVQAVSVINLLVHGEPTSGSGGFHLGSIPIEEDGSFGWTYFPGSELGQEIALLGTLTMPPRVTGAVTVSPSECGALPFLADQDLTRSRGGDDAPALVLPQGGAGTAANGPSYVPWIALAVAAAALLGLGAVSRRRAGR